ncbi:MAG: hypothetical protein K6F25_04815, partial [Bacteroidales bacterium]|nr:hypothetical protein [Bacteroidales bacterium]
GEWAKESVGWDEGRIFFDVPFIVDSTVVDDPLVEDCGYRDCWYATDHLGNVRAVIDITPGQGAPVVLEQSDYLPFGTRIQNAAHASMPANRWRYAGKEEQAFGSLNLGLPDFGARMYDPFTARWTAGDPLAGKYTSYSPFIYCGSNPTCSYDNDGCKIIFINGYTGFGSPTPGYSYWNPANGNYSSFVSKAISILHDKNVMFPEIKHRLSSSAQSRRKEGYRYAKKHFSEIVSDINKNETIKFVSHSMGAAFSEGMAEYMIESGYSVNLLVHFEPYQAKDIETIGKSSDILTIDFQTEGDWVINTIDSGSISGADVQIVDDKHPYSSWRTIHRQAIDSSLSWEQIVSIIQSFLDEH